MDDLQSKLIEWIRAIVYSVVLQRSELDGFIEHLMGKDRLLGAYFARFFTREEELDSMTFHQLSQLAVACRALIVVDDAIRDGDLTPLSEMELAALKEVFTHECAKLLTILLKDDHQATRLLQTRTKQLEQAYEKADRGHTPSYDLICAKCAYLDLPFDALEANLEIDDVTSRRTIAHYVLFALQIADDFADQASDSSAKSSFNLISWRSDISSQAKEEISALPILEYAALVISLVLRKAMILCNDFILLSRWLESAEHLVELNVADSLQYILKKDLYIRGLPEIYLPPSKNFNWFAIAREALMETDVRCHELSAESIHRLATLDALHATSKRGYRSATY